MNCALLCLLSFDYRGHDACAPTLLFCLLFGNNHNITKTPCRVKGQEVRSSCGTTQFLSLPHG